VWTMSKGNKELKNREKIGLLRCYQNIFFMLGIVVRHTPVYFVNFCLFQIYCAAQVFFEFTYTLKVLLDLITKGAEYRTAVEYLLLMLALVLIKLVWAAWIENVTTPRAQEILHRKLRMKLYQKAVELDLEQYDNPEYYNEFVWSINEAAGRMDAILQDFGKTLGQITRILANGVFFLTLDAFGIVFILASLGVTALTQSYIGRVQFARDAKLKPLERKRSYFNRIFYLNDYAKELRLNPVAEQLKEEFSETNSRVYPIVSKYGKRNALAGFLGDFGANDILINTVYLGYLVYKTVARKLLSYGSAMALFSASSSFKNALGNLAMMIPKFEQHGLYVEKIRTFLAYESNMPDGESRLEGNFRELTVENVSFAYGNDEDTLHDISMSVKAGEKIAIVGYNGAGKSTLIKLLLRLYDVRQGTIRLNGRDIREYGKKSYRTLFAAVFQDYKIFASDIADNVKMDVAQETDRERIESALSRSGFSERLETLTEGIYTPLTREFDERGINLSGGEAQKVTIARTFYKYCPIIILDEPSSALDPISEYQLNQTMMEAAKDKAVIYISHRLSSTVMADRIYMLEQGRIIETGSHKELMEFNGKYAQMFKMQAEKYMNISAALSARTQP
ncbi:MAG: ABC transporter ATP-binding protein/permease, partial [Lachnospiraceae bacterium]|nr:ABC transporter ATP-binding protein/permease [Lachnospiraceae bacterium]